MENLNLYAQLARPCAEDERANDVPRAACTSPRLEPFAHRRAGKLSGGMKQKLGLACALMPRPARDAARRAERRRRSGQPAGTVDDGAGADAGRHRGDLVDRLPRRGGALRPGLAAERRRIEFDGPPSSLTRGIAAARIADGIARERRGGLAEALDPTEITTASSKATPFASFSKRSRRRRRCASWPRVTAEIRHAVPRFEDAFIDVLGGGPEDVP